MLDSAQTENEKNAANTAAVATVLLFNPDEPMKFKLNIEDQDFSYEIIQVFSGLPDDVLLEYDRLREVFIESEGKNTNVKTNAIEANEYLFEALCIDVEGFDGEKPENWHEQIDYDEKEYGIKQLLAVKILSSQKEKPLGKRQWGKPISTNAVEIAFYLNGEIVQRKAEFPKKTPAHISAYAAIKSNVGLVDRGVDDSAMKVPASMKAKADLFDEMQPRVEGYTRIPLHHKAAFVTGLFESRISAAGKK
ncbi:MAG TPA: hypothetical protein PKY59_15280 [Pyrinomonadaceae bacterium]|nr:hypothetical protein [Pyrinomonadaceae bacterium]